MFWALDPATARHVQAKPGLKAVCPMCGDPVRSKCGTLTCWHFAHKAYTSCDYWAEGEGPWHFAWKSSVPPHMREVILKRPVVNPDGTPAEWTHRADILNSRGTVIELQHSSLDRESVRNREIFYQNMIWIFDASWVRKDRFRFRRDGDFHEFTWSNAHRWLTHVTKPLFFDLGSRDTIFQAKRLYDTRPMTGLGNFISRADFKKIFFV